MTTHPRPAKVTFTGSVATGKLVAAAAASDLKRVTLELGGNDPAVVLDDVDVAAIAPSLFWLSLYNNGQTCACIKRIYVHESRHDELVDAMVNLAETTVVGDGMAPDTMVGPLSTKPQFRRVHELFKDAVRAGAVVRSGGDMRVHERGFFVRPTILTDLPDTARVVDEEQFGPLIPIMKFSSEADAFRRAADSRYGLGASVWSADVERARAAAAHLQSGMNWINMHADFGPNHPFAGARWSGLGVEGGIDGIHAHMQIHVTQELKG
jgi:acyl-CoA reductase-like NAD-dependent aldehyde dehydrogenase